MSSQLFTVFAASGLIRQVVTVLNFKTEFTDGTSTGHARIAGQPNCSRRSGSARGRCPSPGSTTRGRCTRSTGRAWRITRPMASLARRTSGTRPNSCRPPAAEEIAGFAEVGYLRLDEARRVYRYTWKGAILAVCKLTWPIKPIRQMLRRRKAARILRELGLDRCRTRLEDSSPHLFVASATAPRDGHRPQSLRHRAPSRAIRASAASGPQVPAG